MTYHRFLTPKWWMGGLVLVVGMGLAAVAQQAAKPSDAALARQGVVYLSPADNSLKLTRRLSQGLKF